MGILHHIYRFRVDDTDVCAHQLDLDGDNAKRKPGTV